MTSQTEVKAVKKMFSRKNSLDKEASQAPYFSVASVGQ